MRETDGPKRAQRRSAIFGLLRAVGIAAVLIALYYIAPLDLLTQSLIAAMIIGLLLLAP